jgi:hypothetical protein
MQIDDDPYTSQRNLALQNGPWAVADAPVEGKREWTSSEKTRTRLAPEAVDSSGGGEVVVAQGSVPASPTHHIDSIPLSLQIGDIDETQAAGAQRRIGLIHSLYPCTSNYDGGHDPPSFFQPTPFEYVQVATDNVDGSVPATQQVARETYLSKEICLKA